MTDKYVDRLRVTSIVCSVVIFINMTIIVLNIWFQSMQIIFPVICLSFIAYAISTECNHAIAKYKMRSRNRILYKKLKRAEIRTKEVIEIPDKEAVGH